MKDACRTSTTVTTTLSDLPSTDTGVHKHGPTSTVVETEVQQIPGIKTQLHNLQRTSTTVKRTLSDITSTKAGVHQHQITSIVVEIELQDIPGYETLRMTVAYLPSTESADHKHHHYSCGNWALGYFWL